MGTDYVTTKQAAQMLGVPSSRVRDWARRGLLPAALTEGRDWWFERKAVLAFVRPVRGRPHGTKDAKPRKRAPKT